MEIQKQVEGLIPTLTRLELDQLKLRSDIAIFEQEYKQTEAYKNYLKASRELSELETKELEIRSEAKNLMLMNGLKEFTTLDGTKIMLRKSPGSLKVEKEAESRIPDEFWKVSRSIDKTKLKQAYNEGLITDEGIYIDIDYTLQITQK